MCENQIQSDTYSTVEENPILLAVNGVINDTETKLRAQLLDVVEMVAPADKVGATKRTVDSILRDFTRRTRANTAVVVNLFPGTSASE